MLHTTRLVLVLLALALGPAGCNLLFPELGGSSTATADLLGDDLLGLDLSTGPIVTGYVCALSDLRVLGSCTAVSGHGLHVSVEETRDTATVDTTGHFTVHLSQAIATATLGVSTTDNTYLATATQVAVGSAELAIPVYAPSTLSTALVDNGYTLDDTKAQVIAYVVNSASVPVLGVKATAAGGDGVLYDGRSTNQLDATSETGANGVVLLVNQPAPTVTLSLTPTAGSGVGANSYTLPTRPGAVTFGVTVMPAN